MDNITHLPGAEPHSTITLTASRYALYQTTCIEVNTPDGEYLESIGQHIQNDLAETNTYQLRDNIYLVACLLGKINENVELPAHAVSGLADLFYRMQNFCGEHIK
ncbi:MAG: hypothetical protein V4660_06575 [Pseudomonadota bacterium]